MAGRFVSKAPIYEELHSLRYNSFLAKIAFVTSNLKIVNYANVQ